MKKIPLFDLSLIVVWIITFPHYGVNIVRGDEIYRNHVFVSNQADDFYSFQYICEILTVTNINETRMVTQILKSNGINRAYVKIKYGLDSKPYFCPTMLQSGNTEIIKCSIQLHAICVVRPSTHIEGGPGERIFFHALMYKMQITADYCLRICLRAISHMYGKVVFGIWNSNICLCGLHTDVNTQYNDQNQLIEGNNWRINMTTDLYATPYDKKIIKSEVSINQNVCIVNLEMFENVVTINLNADNGLVLSKYKSIIETNDGQRIQIRHNKSTQSTPVKCLKKGALEVSVTIRDSMNRVVITKTFGVWGNEMTNIIKVECPATVNTGEYFYCQIKLFYGNNIKLDYFFTDMVLREVVKSSSQEVTIPDHDLASVFPLPHDNDENFCIYGHQVIPRSRTGNLQNLMTVLLLLNDFGTRVLKIFWFPCDKNDPNVCGVASTWSSCSTFCLTNGICDTTGSCAQIASPIFSELHHLYYNISKITINTINFGELVQYNYVSDVPSSNGSDHLLVLTGCNDITKPNNDRMDSFIYDERKFTLDMAFFCDKPTKKKIYIQENEHRLNSSSNVVNCVSPATNVSDHSSVISPKKLVVLADNDSYYEAHILLKNFNEVTKLSVIAAIGETDMEIFWGVKNMSSCACVFPYIYLKNMYYGCVEEKEQFACPSGVKTDYTPTNLIPCPVNCPKQISGQPGASVPIGPSLGMDDTFINKSETHYTPQVFIELELSFNQNHIVEYVELLAKSKLNNDTIKLMKWKSIIFNEIDLSQWMLNYRPFELFSASFEFELKFKSVNRLPTTPTLEIHPIVGKKEWNKSRFVETSRKIPFIVEKKKPVNGLFNIRVSANHFIFNKASTVESFTFEKMGLDYIFANSSDSDFPIVIKIPSFSGSIGSFGFSVRLFYKSLPDNSNETETVQLLDSLPEGTGKIKTITAKKFKYNWVEKYDILKGPIVMDLRYIDQKKNDKLIYKLDYINKTFMLPSSSILKFKLKLKGGNPKRIKANIISTKHPYQTITCSQDWPEQSLMDLNSWEFSSCDCPEIGDYNIALEAWNPLSQNLSSKFVKLKVFENIGEIQILTSGELSDKKKKKNFEIRCDFPTDNVCLVIDFGDGGELRLFGSPSICKIRYKNLRNLKQFTCPSLNVTHTYSEIGKYEMSVEAFDDILSTKSKTSVRVAPLDCKSMSVAIQGGEDRITTATPKVKRSESYEAVMIASISCNESVTTYFRWKIFSIMKNNDSSESSIEVAIENILPTWNLTTLVIKERFLNVGFYKLVARFGAGMMEYYEEETEMFEESYSYVEIIYSPLIAVLINDSVSEVKIGWLQSIVLQPGMLSIDPDFPGSKDFNFTWWCKVSTEIYENLDEEGIPIYDPELAMPIPDANTVPQIFDDSPGCFGFGPGPMEYSSGVLVFNISSFIMYDRTYEIACTVSKMLNGVFRRSVASVNLKIEWLSLKIPTLKCSLPKMCPRINGLFFVDPKMSLSFSGACTSECDGTETFYWEISLPDPYELDEKKCDDELIPESCKWIYGDGTKRSVTSKDLKMSEYFFEFLPKGVPSFEVRIYLTWSQFDGVRMKNVSGSASIFLVINRPPTNGTCDIGILKSGKMIPLYTGVTLIDEFIVECQGFVDPEDHKISEYVLKSVEGDSSLILYAGSSSKFSVFFPPGIFDLTVEIYDQLKTFSVFNLRINFIVNITTKQEYEDLDIPKMIKNYQDIGDTTKVNQIFLADAVIRSKACWYNITCNLQYDRPLDQELSNLTMQQRNTFDEILLNTTSSNLATFDGLLFNLKNGDVNQAAQTANILNTLTQRVVNNPLLSNTLDMKSREKILKILDRVAEILSSPGTGDTKKIYETIRNALNPAANVIRNLNNILYNNDPESIPLADRVIAKDLPYDTDIPDDNADIPDDIEEAFKMNSLKLTRLSATKQIHQALKVIDKYMETIWRKTLVKDAFLDLFSSGLTVRVLKSSGSEFVGSDTDRDGKLDRPLTYMLKDGPSMIEFPLGFCPGAPSTGFIDYKCKGVYSTVIKLWDNPVKIYPHSARQLSRSSKQIDVDIFDAAGNKIIVRDMKKYIKYRIDRINTKIPEEFKDTDFIKINSTSHLSSLRTQGKPPLVYHYLNVSRPYSSLTIQIKAGDRGKELQMILLAGVGYLPTLARCDAIKVLGNIRDYDEDGFRNWFLSEEVVKNRTGPWYIAVGSKRGEKSIPYDERPCSENKLKKTDLEWDFGVEEYVFRAYISGCYYFNTTSESWDGNGLKNFNSRRLLSDCGFNRLVSLSSGFHPEGNVVDFELYFVRSAFSDNFTICVFLTITLSLYFLALIWAFIFDLKDSRALKSPPMADNHPEDKYFYEILVETGPYANNRTTSNIDFILYGDEDSTEIRRLNDSERNLFRSGETDAFLMSTNRPLGTLRHLKIWTDSSGLGDLGSWYLMSVTVLDVQTGDKWRFIGDKWLSLERDNGEDDVVLFSIDYGDIEDIKYVLRTCVFRSLNFFHLWISVFNRPVRSRFTRAHKATLCLASLYLSMLISAISYRILPERISYSLFGYYFLSFDIYDIGVGFLTNLSTLIPILILSVGFYKSRVWNLKTNRIDVSLLQALEKNKFKPSGEGNGKKRQICNLEKRRNHSWSPFYGILTWIVCISIVGSSLLATVTIINNFNKECTHQFLVAVFSSFLSSFLILQPLLVTFSTFIYGLCLRRANYFDDDHCEEDEEPPTIYFDESDKASIERRARCISNKKRPMEKEFYDNLRNLRIKEFEMRTLLSNLIIYVFYVSVIFIIGYGSRDLNAFWEKQSLVSTVVHGGVNCEIFLKENLRYKKCLKDNAMTMNFQHIVDVNDWWTWLEKTFIDNTRVQPWYNGQPPYGLRGYLNDRVNRIIGYAIIRQVRQGLGTCKTHSFIRDEIEDCTGIGTIETEDNRDWCKKWIPKTNKNCTYASEYQYVTADKLESLPIPAPIRSYGGGGYIFRIKGHIGHIKKKIMGLQTDGWTDNRTRGLIAEFSVYNAQINMFATITCIAEFIGGGIRPYHRVDVFRLFGNRGIEAVMIRAAEILFIFVTFYYAVNTFANMKKQGIKGFFSEFWNCSDLATIICSIAGISFYLARLFIVEEMTKKISETGGNAYIRLTIPALINNYYDYCVSFLIFTTTLKLCQLLSFQKTFRQIAATLQLCFKGLSTFLLEFFTVFGAFCSFFFLVLMNDLESFRDFLRSFENTLSMSIGKFNFKDLKDANIIAAWIFFAFSIAVNMVLINMVMAIINMAFEEVKERGVLYENKFEIIQYTKKCLKEFIGLQKPKAIEPVYADPPNDESAKSCSAKSNPGQDLSKKTEMLLKYIEITYFSKSRQLNEEEKEFIRKIKDKGKNKEESFEALFQLKASEEL